MPTETVSIHIISAVKSLGLALIGAFVFVSGFHTLAPLTEYGLASLGSFGAYYGLHVYVSNKFIGAKESGTTSASTPTSK
jgi:hypothetical protein